jgi:hypothetical protein
MTGFFHQKRSGRRKNVKPREHKPMGLGSPDALLAHREMEWLRNPTPERWRKLQQARRAAGDA